MTLAVFNFPFHKVRHLYPAGDQQKFGSGYTYAVKPLLPEQRTFVLTFAALQWGAPVATYDMQALIDFYEAHRLWDRFTYPHPQYGNLTVRFGRALEVPQSLDGGTGVTEQCEIQLIEQPL